MQHFIRVKGSTYHLIYFDLRTRRINKRYTLQGFNDESCWLRGQAWTIYEFAIAYTRTKREEFLRATEKLTGYYMTNCPSDSVPYWDFNDSEIPNTVKDSSAAAITTSGLFDLPGFSDKRKNRDALLNILNSLCEDYLEESYGVLKNGCFNKPEARGVDESLIWGDYYFIDLLTKVVH